MTDTRIYLLDTIAQDSIMGTHVAPFEDAAGVDTTRISLSQLTQYFFNGASTTDDSGPLSGYPLIVGNNSYTSDGSNSNVTIFGPSNEIWRDDGGGNTGCTALGYNNNINSNWGASAVGYRNHITNSRASAFGHKNIVTATGSSGFGNGNTVSGDYSTGSGYYNVVSGDYSVAHGVTNQATDDYTTSVGVGNVANIEGASAVGNSNYAMGYYSSSFGYKNLTSMITWGDTQYNIIDMNIGQRKFTISGNQTEFFWESILVQNNNDARNNGLYTINDVTFDSTNTVITVNENIIGYNNSSGYILGDLNFDVSSPWPIITVDTGSSIFMVLGDHVADYQNSVVVQVYDSAYNDGYYVISNVATGEGTTNITVEGSIPSSTADGFIVANKADSNLGWGTSAFGYKNIVTDSQSQAFGHYNTVSGRYSSAVGASNRALCTHSTAFGCYNTVADYDNTIQGSGWGASAVGYSNRAYASQSSAFGHINHAYARLASAIGNHNTASGYYSSAIGSSNTASNNYSTAVGYDNSASGYSSTAVGYENFATGGHSTAVGYNNEASAAWGSSAVGHNNTAATANQTSAFGHSNTATGHSASAFGFNNNASGNHSSAFGAGGQASGDFSTTLGYQAYARWPNTANISGGIIIRGDNGESTGYELLNYSGVTNIVMSKDFDLTTTGHIQIAIPTHCLFYVDEVGVIVSGTVISLSVQPTVEFGNGYSGSSAVILGPVQTTNLLETGSRQIYTSLLTNDGQSLLTATVTSAASATHLYGRFYFKGILIENTPVGS